MEDEKIEIDPQELLDILWFNPDYPINVFNQFNLMNLEMKYLVELNQPIHFGVYTLYMFENEGKRFFNVTKNETYKKVYDFDWKLISGLFCIKDFETVKVGETLLDKDIYNFLNYITSTFNSENTVQKIVDDDQIIYEAKNSVYDVEYRFNINDDLPKMLRIINRIKTVTISLDQNNKILQNETNHEIIHPKTLSDIKKYQRYYGSDVNCIISNNLSEINISLFIDNEAFYEAGILFFGNEGDLSIINAQYWKNRQGSPYYNPGWILYGYIVEQDDTFKWYPYNNDFSDEEEWLDEWIEIWELKKTKNELLEDKKHFILEDVIGIKIKLMEMGLKFDEIIEY